MIIDCAINATKIKVVPFCNINLIADSVDALHLSINNLHVYIMCILLYTFQCILFE